MSINLINSINQRGLRVGGSVEVLSDKFRIAEANGEGECFRELRVFNINGMGSAEEEKIVWRG
jgi:hypothetical protein